MSEETNKINNEENNVVEHVVKREEEKTIGKIGEGKKKEKEVKKSNATETIKDSGGYLKRIFGGYGDGKSKGYIKAINLLKELPYQIIGFFLLLSGWLLIPKKKILTFSRISLPIFFGVSIIFLLFSSGIYVSLTDIDFLLFGSFFPLVGWLPGLLFFTAFVLNIVRGYKKVNRTEQGTEKSLYIFLFSFLAVIVSFLIFGDQGTFLYSIYNNLSIFFSSSFGYLVYFSYIFLLLNLIFTLYRKIIYIIFSVFNREKKAFSHIFSAALIILFIFILNNFLNITLIAMN